MTPNQMKAARTLLGWNRVLLAARSGTSVYTVATFEEFGRVVTSYGRTGHGNPLAAIFATLKAAGVELVKWLKEQCRLTSFSPSNVKSLWVRRSPGLGVYKKRSQCSVKR